MRVEQSIVRQWFYHGSVLISMKEMSNAIVFKYVNSPDAVRKDIKDSYVKADKIKLF